MSAIPIPLFNQHPGKAFMNYYHYSIMKREVHTHRIDLTGMKPKNAVEKTLDSIPVCRANTLKKPHLRKRI